MLRFRMIRWSIYRAIVHGDTVEGLMVLQDALDNRHYERLARQLASSPAWQRLSAVKPRMHTDQLQSARIRALPESTFGGALREHMLQNGFVDQPRIPDSPFPCSPPVEWAKTRWRECHDARHALTGLLPTPADEARLHAFQLAQHPTWFSVLICLFVPLFAWRGTTPVQTWLRLPDAFRAGRRARRVADLEVESLLDHELDEVRSAFRVRALGAGPRPLVRRSDEEMQRASSPFAADEKERTAYLLLQTLAVVGVSVAVLLAGGPAWLDVLAVLGLTGGMLRIGAFAHDVQHGALFLGSRVAARCVAVLDGLSGGALGHADVHRLNPRIPFYRRAEAGEALRSRAQSPLSG